MNKLYNYLSKLGITETTSRARYNEEAPATFYRETYGDSGYFTNAPGYTYPAAVVVLDYNVDAPADYFRKQKTLERMIERYCKRYHYSIIENRAFYGAVYITIATEADRENAENYYFFRDRCVNECEIVAHELYEAGKPEEVNAALGAIMTEHGEYYNQFLQANERRTA